MVFEFRKPFAVEGYEVPATEQEQVRQHFATLNEEARARYLRDLPEGLDRTNFETIAFFTYPLAEKSSVQIIVTSHDSQSVMLRHADNGVRGESICYSTELDGVVRRRDLGITPEASHLRDFFVDDFPPVVPAPAEGEIRMRLDGQLVDYDEVSGLGQMLHDAVPDYTIST